MRSTKRVLIGSLAAASPSASRATSTGTPSISNMMRPGLIRHTHSSGVPLPLPMRTSIGFFDTGTSGNTLIHTRPQRFMWRVLGRLDLARGHALRLERLEAELAEVELVRRGRKTVDTALVRLAEFAPDRLQHGCRALFALRRVAARTSGLALGEPLVLRHRIVFEDLALEDPHLHAAGAVGGESGRGAVVDVGTQ